jgi:hypothetical protein
MAKAAKKGAKKTIHRKKGGGGSLRSRFKLPIDPKPPK